MLKFSNNDSPAAREKNCMGINDFISEWTGIYIFQVKA